MTPNTAADMGALLMIFVALCLAIPVLLASALAVELARLAWRCLRAVCGLNR